MRFNGACGTTSNCEEEEVMTATKLLELTVMILLLCITVALMVVMCAYSGKKSAEFRRGSSGALRIDTSHQDVFSPDQSMVERRGSKTSVAGLPTYPGDHTPPYSPPGPNRASLDPADVDVTFASVCSIPELMGSTDNVANLTVETYHIPQIELLPRCPIKWNRGPIIGKGSFGKVHLALLDDGRILAVKTMDVLRRMKPAEVQSLLTEVHLMSNMTHQHIVQYQGVDFNPVEGTLNILMEFVEGGSLGAIVRRMAQRLPERTACRYIAQVLHALVFLHGRSIVHRDIKGDNILINSQGRIKLADLGCCGTLEETCGGQHAPLVGSPYWMAPEVIAHLPHSTPADIWGLGCTLAEILNFGKPPWPEFPNVWSAILFIGRTTGPPTELPTSGLSKQCRAFMMACLERDPALRPTAEELLTHEWILMYPEDGVLPPLTSPPLTSIIESTPPAS
jgi:hypothetical protein